MVQLFFDFKTVLSSKIEMKAIGISQLHMLIFIAAASCQDSTINNISDKNNDETDSFDMSWQNVHDELLKHLLDNHDTRARASSSNGGPVTVSVQFMPNFLIQLDEKTQTLEITGIFSFYWHDRRLCWTPQAFGNISYVIAKQSNIWKPYFTISNSIEDKKQAGLDDNVVHIESYGAVTWSLEEKLRVKCNIDVSLYPFDSQTCHLSLTFPGTTTMDVLPQSNPIAPVSLSIIRNSNEFIGGNWEITGSSCQEITFGFQSYEQQTKYRTIMYSLYFRRKR